MVCGWVGALVVGLGYFDYGMVGEVVSVIVLEVGPEWHFGHGGWDLGSQYGVLGKLI